ncbi:MAG: Ribonuclease R [Parcubacteria group bacterium GW2011_GWB1_49_7]|uniref:Ribonuclease R n=1 Tax=Candidatus Zambryskibacteria bacterium RIFCSPHIGHO2_01_FULL_46_25 TaxID=1802738 RepID=A0A1G2SZJ9_9BACT|nr:MAG: Ribonuclease R [Parcubacteria group bacterium GW2011_GWB1_49_7]OHA90476.1 MAG: ribonuclease R [Candidatus Zambryskibacteria bacterium RIFCSPHIGHO2_01_FULL_46_25]OHB01555.1 MAG: ribonuclease R [Candidatus Zambryskibacteria bacterium RIFCSPHIGHO2_12_FULL_48_10]OHB07016.1 MAG: ribonuclease R [Candidatus Zambryskibacteria bacterium RIFCSPLOWO2_01_FULL_48_25]
MLEGTIRVTGKGVGYFEDPQGGDDFEIQPENLKAALNRDTVIVEPTGKEIYGRKQAKVVEILERHKTEFVGTFDDGFMIPDDKRMYRDIFVEDPKGAKNGDKIQVHLTSWEDPSKSPKGEILRVIGRAGEHNAEMVGIVLESGFEIDFPPEVESEAEAWKERYEKEDKLKNRRDFSEVTTFTIDPADAKDFDDAISLKKLENGDYEIGVHIADVSHFVTPGTALDKEAVKRGTSIYLVDRTIPMLPEVLSNDLCSLNPNEPKYAFSAVFVMDKNAKVKDRWFGKTLIESDKRFTYEEAQEILDKKSGTYYEELKTLNDLAYKLREEKFRKGAIEFETEEVKFELDELGKPIRVYKKERKDTHKLVEDFMLLANREVATHMHTAYKSNARAAFVYRIHDAPDREKIVNLATFVKALGFELKNRDGETTAEDITKMLKSVEGTPTEMLVKTAAIRSMSKAIYSTSNIGHFGLAFEYYTHFTSPIRRYPDLMVHRLLQRFIEQGQIEQDEIIKYQRLCDDSSEREMEAAEAERASIKYKQVEYMQEHVGEEFDAIISGVSEWGIYVEEVNTKAEGMVKLRDMKDDFYELNEKLYAIVGQKSGKKYSLGDKVRVKLIASDPERKTLDFAFV